MSDIDEMRRQSQDDETRGQIMLLKAEAYPRLARAGWLLRYEGEDGLGLLDQPKRNLRIIHSIAREQDGDVWAHLSLSRRDRTFPTWEQTRDAWWLIYPNLAGVIVVAPQTKHVNVAEVAHVCGNLSKPAVPDFTRGLGTI
ncbi:MAG: hypothetical protein H0W70_10270 [Actinobacteria bacterium]|nr:hypothetical protein [Actinomycetota bacterium]